MLIRTIAHETLSKIYDGCSPQDLVAALNNALGAYKSLDAVVSRRQDGHFGERVRSAYHGKGDIEFLRCICSDGFGIESDKLREVVYKMRENNCQEMKELCSTEDVIQW